MKRWPASKVCHCDCECHAEHSCSDVAMQLTYNRQDEIVGICKECWECAPSEEDECKRNPLPSVQ